VKEGTLKFLGRCLSNAPTPILGPQVKPLSETLAALLEDSFEGARTEAATCLGTLMKMVGERPMNALLDGLPDMRKTKVKEAHEKATIKCKPAGTGAPKVAAPVQTKPVAKKLPLVAKPIAVNDDADPPPKKPAPKPPAKAPVRILFLHSNIAS
jgi:cytoskeleton-associated protein 5